MNLIQHIQNFTIYDWLLAIGLIALLGIQFFTLRKQKSSKRFKIKIALNLVLWLIVCLFVINPKWEKSTDSNRVLVYGNDVPLSVVNQLKDSLKIKESFSQKSFDKSLIENPNFANQVGKVFIVGQDAKPEILSKVAGHAIEWIPSFKENELQELHWSAVLRKGDMQEVSGKINLTESNILYLKWGKQTIDSLKLSKGFNNFSLKVPVFTLGASSFDLFLDEDKLRSIEFFAQKNQAFRVLMILTNPDFESKTLADWLGRNGNQVKIISTVAKNTQSAVSINQIDSNFTPDLIITDPSNATNSLVKKAYSEGKGIFFINLSQADVAAKSINQALGTNWTFKRISIQENIPISADLTALPYSIQAHDFQKSIGDFPIAIQKKNGTVGVSLLNETFPLMLSGDSLSYMKIWQGALHLLRPSNATNVLLSAPVFKDSPTEITINSEESLVKIKVEKDTVNVQKSAINPFSSQVNYTFRATGWQKLGDSVEVFVENSETQLAKSHLLQPYLNTSPTKSGETQKLSVEIPEWLWLLMLVLALGALWVEPKV
ncbi:MAG: hypothetical protein ACOVO2_01430 [Emticicia sp.]|uniref:hypothetical protein n=1 Tax=Emticicia sp. TaxID=1930953 RepID=UPI003BA48AC8